MAVLADAGVTGATGYLVGLGPLTSERQARWLVDNLWGTVIPEPIIDLLGKASDPRAEGRRIVADIARAYVEIPGVTGVHMMGHRAEAESAEIIVASDILDLR
jgi:methylenetetrahydrofolate reductase (NADPH)